MTDINKQKFLAELGKLLTFMYEEDRQRAVAMYTKMFEDAPDEQTLLQALGSPTRQAVIVARAYNAKERKLQVEAQTREVQPQQDGDATPDYVLAINKIYEEAIPEQPEAAAPLEDQFSLFDGLPTEAEPEAPAPAEAESVLPEEPEPVPEEEPEPPAEAPVEVPAPVEEEPEAPSGAEEPELSAPAEAESLPTEEAETAPAGESEEEPVPATPDEVDAFIAEFLIENDELAESAPEAEAVKAPEPEPPLPEPVNEPEDEPVIEESRPVRKPRVFLLILYILLAIPVTLLGIAVLLIPTLLALALAVAVMSVGSALAFTAFTGFSILADILIVAGAALIVLGLGLLVLWTFVWFIGGPIVGLIHSVVSLGGKWCYKEVAA